MAKTTKELKTTLDWANAYVAFGLKVLPCYAIKKDGDCMCPPRSKYRFHKDKETGRESYEKCKSAGKHPAAHLVPNGSLDASSSIDTIKGWFSNDRQYNIAVATGKCHNENNLAVTDLDITKGKDGPATWDALQKELGEKFPDTLRQITGSGGKHYFWWTDSEVSNSSESKLGSGIDVRGKSGYVVVPPSRNKLGEYRWENWAPQPNVIVPAPKALEDRAVHGKRAIASPAVTVRAAAPTRDISVGPVLVDDSYDRLTQPQVQELLKFVPPGPRDNWLMFGFTLKTIADWIGGEEKAFDVWDTWAENGDGYGGLTDQQNQWSSFNEPTRYPIALLKKHAKEGGWKPSEAFQREDRKWRTDSVQEQLKHLSNTASADDVRALLAMIAKLPKIDRDPFIKDIKSKTENRFSVSAMRDEMTAFQRLAAPDQTDLGVAVAHQVLSKHFGNGKLLIRSIDKAFWRYNGWYWEPVKNDDEIRKLCVEETLALDDTGSATVNSISQQALDLLEAMQALPGDPLRLTQPPPPVINCRNGELWINDDLSLNLRPHQPESYLRYGIKIDYNPQAECPTFDKALRDIFQAAGTEDTRPQAVEDMCRHMMEVVGYAIQPRRHYKLYLIFYGRGNNGKSKLVEVITALVTEDCVHAGRIGKLESSEYLISHLCNKLLFVDDDVDSNTILPDGILKKISESKLIQGRDPYGKPREFKVSVVPMLLANNYPYSKDLSRGTQIRAHVIPFAHEFQDGIDLDRKLFERIITTELAGILNRAIEGLQRLEGRGGFKEPLDCLKAKAAFMASANPLVAFIEQECQTKDQAREEIEMRLSLDLEVEEQHSKLRKGKIVAGVSAITPEELRRNAAVALAKLEACGIEQDTQEFYDRFKQWCEREGINWKPRKSDVERDLVHSGFYVGPGAHQKVNRPGIAGGSNT